MNHHTTSTRPRAVASGTIFGNVDCYVLEDGTTVLSQRGMLSGLRGKTDGNDTGNLGQYLARLPEKYSGLATGTSFDFVRPDGGVAIGRPARDFVAMCRAYAEMYTEGGIHKARIPMARNAIAILSHLADRGIDEIVYEAANYRPVPVSDSQPTLLARLTATIEALHARVESLESRPVANLDRPAIGAGAARLHVLNPLREIAAIEARAAKRDGDKRALASLRLLAENDLRSRLGFQRVGGQSWDRFPHARLGDLHCALVSLFHAARRRADILTPTATQLRLIKKA